MHILGAEALGIPREVAFTAITRAKTSLTIYHTAPLPGFLDLALAPPPTALPNLGDLFLTTDITVRIILSSRENLDKVFRGQTMPTAAEANDTIEVPRGHVALGYPTQQREPVSPSF